MERNILTRENIKQLVINDMINRLIQYLNRYRIKFEITQYSGISVHFNEIWKCKYFIKEALKIKNTFFRIWIAYRYDNNPNVFTDTIYRIDDIQFIRDGGIKIALTFELNDITGVADSFYASMLN